MTGIPITVVLKELSEHDQNGERHKFYPPVKGEEQRQAEDEVAMIKAMENDFRDEAEKLLDIFNLSYLRPKIKAPKHGNVE
ncbi:MAG TPA: hypothetical protein VMC84_04000 [Methanocella sp.]|uniref:hypothetical protein n=1 Tax=Methanocella sp. TaxID=2052833 RepID=UPI002CD48B70|nr:hypothetical protein [Methanocella sp.]HTY90317.1 hypothetical protein [Methanocella sp.]